MMKPVRVELVYRWMAVLSGSIPIRDFIGAALENDYVLNYQRLFRPWPGTTIYEKLLQWCSAHNHDYKHLRRQKSQCGIPN